MSFLKKLTLTVIALSFITAYTAFAENTDTELEDDITVTLMSADLLDVYDAGLSAQEIDIVEYVVNEICTNHSETIELPENYIADHRRFYDITRSILSYIQIDHPEIYYLKQDLTPEGYMYHINCRYNPMTDLITSFQVEYSMTDAEIKAMDRKINLELNRLTSGITPDMSDLEKALIVHDNIANGYKYDERVLSSDFETNMSAVRTLDRMVTEKTGVCQGYSYLYMTAMNKLGIECINVPCDVYNHMWNKVKIDGEWYNVDVTYDDPMPDEASHIVHAFFLLSDDEIRVSDADTDIPERIGQHSEWNYTDWKGEPVITAESTRFSNLSLHNVEGPIVLRNNKVFCVNDANDICEVIFNDGAETTLRERYTLTRDYYWFLTGQHDYAYSDKFTTLALYKGRIYFNTPNEVYMFNEDDYSAKLVYTYDIGDDPSNTYFYGMTVSDGVLYADYSDSPSYALNYIPIDVSDGDDEVIVPVFDEPPCTSETVVTEVVNEETGEPEVAVEITVDIPEDVVEILEERPKVLVAKYDDNGILLGLETIEIDPTASSGSTVAVGNDCAAVKTFVWSSLFHALANAEFVSLSGS